MAAEKAVRVQARNTNDFKNFMAWGKILSSVG
jgi:hypothetical protein